MSRLTLLRDVGWAADVYLLDRARELKIDFRDEHFGKLVRKIERMRYVDEVEDRHQFWARIHPETGNPTVAARRVAAVIDKIERAMQSARKQAS